MKDAPVGGIDVKEHLGGKIPLDLTFVNDSGRTVRLAEYFRPGRPVLLVLAYYNCPMLCTLVLNGVADVMKKVAWQPGKEYQVVTVSIDPRESDTLAALKRTRYLEYLGRPGSAEGWRFHVGSEDQIRKLADAIGFEYFYMEDRKEYAHPAAIYVLTADGTISRYLYGIQFNERDVRLAVLEASEGKIGSTVDRLLLYCFHYDPDAKGYVVLATNVMKLGGLATLLIFGVFLVVLWIRDKTKPVEE